MATFLLAFAVVSAIILVLHLALSAGVIANMAAENAAHPARTSQVDTRPEVIVAVRDEEATLPKLLESLRAQTRADVLFLFVNEIGRAHV
jgi:hypothetical protein